MMFVRLKVGRAGIGFYQQIGDIVAVPDDEAERLVAKGKAERVEATQPSSRDPSPLEKRRARKGKSPKQQPLRKPSEPKKPAAEKEKGVADAKPKGKEDAEPKPVPKPAPKPAPKPQADDIPPDVPDEMSLDFQPKGE